jgi:uncharacterized protein (TIGR00255 family)
MTGSGSAAGSTEVGELRIELRSVNGRGLLLKQRLCSEAIGFEAAFDEALRAAVARGTVTLVVERAGGGGGYDRESLRRQLQDLRALAADLGLVDDVSLRDLLALAGGALRAEAGSRPLPPRLQALLRAALDDLQRHRSADGAAAVAAMRAQFDALDGLLAVARERAPQIARTYGDKLQRRVNEILAEHGLQLQPADVLREIALFADRSDVTEELHRLGAHLAEARALFAQGGELGRKLEFLLQEMLREANTLGAKSPDAAMAHAVVAIKSAIDKLKEQAANLE